MTELERKLIRRLLFEPETMSRNRNFHAFEDAWARRARRQAAHLRSLRKGIRAKANTVAIEGEAAGLWTVEVVDPRSGVRRQASVSDEELSILCEDPVCASRLGRPRTEVGA